MYRDADALIIGGGVSGLATAIALGASGHEVLVVDKAAMPRDKVCGEGIMPTGLDALRRLGLDPETLPGSTFAGLAYRSGRSQAHLRFPPGQTGRGVPRTALIEALHDAAVARPGVRIVQDRAVEPVWSQDRIVAVRGLHATYRARAILAADGAHSGLATQAAVPLYRYGERMAVRRHYCLPEGEVPPDVCIGLFAPYDIYLTPVGGRTLLATTMTDRAGYRAIRRDYDGFLRASPYAHLFAHATASSAVLGWHHPLCAPRRYTVGGMLIVGDAGGSVDPCLGVGMSMALTTARFAAGATAALLRSPEDRDHLLAHYEAQRRKLFRHYSGFGRVFRFMVRSPRGSAMLVRAMKECPGLAERLLAIIGTGRPWRSLFRRIASDDGTVPIRSMTQ